MAPRITILHATYRREGGPVWLRDRWLERAERPEEIEWLFSMDADDEISVEDTQGQPRVVNPPWDDRVTAVRNWNAAADSSTGDLLVVVSDDLEPPQNWDTGLRSIAGALDPRRIAFAIKVDDKPALRNDSLLRHPVISREFFLELGLFSPRFEGLYCDDDITQRAFRRAFIVDGRSLKFQHLHPAVEQSRDPSCSQSRVSSREQYRLGRPRYDASWSAAQRRDRILLVKPSAVVTPSRLRLRATRLAFRVASRIYSRSRATAGGARDRLSRTRSPTRH